MRVRLSLLLVLATLLAVVVISADDYISQYSTRVRCSRLCPCYYQSLFCKGYQYYHIPADTSDSVQNIDFSDNNLIAVTNDTLSKFTELRKLLLGDNEVSQIDDGAFTNQRLLNALDLSGNRLSEIRKPVFDPIRRKLEHLSLYNNNLTRIEGMFQKMRSLRTLNLKDNSIEVLTAETLFQNRKLRYLQLSNNKLHYVSEDTFRRLYLLQYLFIDNNNMENVTKLKLPSKHLETLSFINCRLAVIPAGISRTIRQMNIAGNQLVSLSINDLSKLRNLESLDMSRNKMTIVDPKAFRHSNVLKILYLGKNRLQEVPMKLPESLLQLTLDNNIISDLPKGIFSTTVRLTKLALNNNMLEFIHPRALSGLSSLLSLDLSHNIISRLSTDTFADLIGLQELDLSNNPLVYLEPGSLDGLWGLDSLSLNNLGNKAHLKVAILPDCPQLRILNLQNSEALTKSLIRYDLTMYHLRSVEFLDLMNNNLNSLQSTFPQYLPNLRRIQLSSNPWTCNRDLYWLKTWLINGMVEEPHLSYIFCDHPKRVRGRQVVDLDPYDWVIGDHADED